nr:amino acid permease [Falsarthrobacter nasiphocae]
MQMIAIGGAIGTGLFVASGGSIAEAGPGGALLAYALIGFMVLLMMQSLGEMASFLPAAGSFQTYASRFVSRSFGFAVGWNYWFNWAITVAAELVAAGLVMQYWLPDVPGWIWAAVFLALLFGLNYLSAKAFGEGEFWFASIKVVAVIAFLICGVLMIVGIMSGPSPGFSNWTEGEAPFKGGVMGVFSIFLIAGFSFQGTELVGVAAGEAKDPGKHVPKAIRTVFWRIMLFYIGAITVIGFLIPYTSPNLLKNDESDIAFSPFTMVFENAGIAFAAALMNAVILTSILSAGNSGLYASTRMLYGLAVSGSAPKIFMRLNKRGVPVPALIATASVGLFGFLTAIIGQGEAYAWLLNVSALSGFIVWIGISICHYRFRRAYIRQGRDLNDLPYKAPFFPYGPILAFIVFIVIIIGQGYGAIGEGNLLAVLSAYIGIPAFLLLWLGYHMVKKDRVVPLDEVDLDSEVSAPVEIV